MSRCSDRTASRASSPDGSGPAASNANWSADNSSQRNSVTSFLSLTRVDDSRLHRARIVDLLVEVVEVLERLVHDRLPLQLSDLIPVQGVNLFFLRVEERNHLGILLGRHAVAAIQPLAHRLEVQPR